MVCILPRLKFQESNVLNRIVTMQNLKRSRCFKITSTIQIFFFWTFQVQKIRKSPLLLFKLLYLSVSLNYFHKKLKWWIISWNRTTFPTMHCVVFMKKPHIPVVRYFLLKRQKYCTPSVEHERASTQNFTCKKGIYINIIKVNKSNGEHWQVEEVNWTPSILSPNIPYTVLGLCHVLYCYLN